VNEEGTLLPDAVFEACRTIDSNGVDIELEECYEVTDDQSTGVFNYSGIALGTWSIREKTPPPGYRGDSRVDNNIVLTPFDNEIAISEPWVNRLAGQIVETGTTCVQYVAGDANELNEVIYRLKQGVINNVAPGVFFYYTTFTAPSADFAVDIVQTPSDPAYEFHVQNNEQVRLYNSNGCSLVTASTTINNGQVSVDITGAPEDNNVYVMSVKYETGNVVGFNNPGTIEYGFSTQIDSDEVDKNGNGLLLKSKGN
jgi:hypothetical protein